jgi:hypothetical protein
VTSATTGIPTGTASFYDGTALLGTVPLAGGTATYSTASLAAGVTHLLTVAYSGDSNFNASKTLSSSVAVNGLDFTLTSTGASAQTVDLGTAATYSFLITPLYGSYAGTVSFGVDGLPAGTTATFSPASIAANSGAQKMSVTIQTSSLLGESRVPSPLSQAAPIALAFLLLPLFGAGRIRRISSAGGSGLLLVLLAIAGLVGTAMLTGCGSGFHAHDYTVTVTASSGSLQHKSTVTLHVQ